LSLARRLAIALARPRPPRGAPDAPELDSVRRLLVVRAHDQLGDFLMATPALLALRLRFPAAHVTLVVNPYLAPLALHQPDVDRVLVTPWGQGRGGRPGPARFWRALREAPYDLALVLNTVSHSLTSDLLARAAGARRVAGPTTPPLKDAAGAPLYDWALEPAAPAGAHWIERALAVVAALGCGEVPRAYRFALTPDEEAIGERLRAALPPGPVVGVHVGTKDAANRYPVPLWIEAAERVAERLGAHLALFDAPDARAARDQVARGLAAPHTSLPPLTLRETAAALARLDLCLCHDSAPLHLAAAVGTPTVSIHGRSPAALWKPPGDRHVALQTLDLLPASVPPAEVAEAAGRALAAAPERARATLAARDRP
jgi:ADP-heptose:LPS heptosyltransferase